MIRQTCQRCGYIFHDYTVEDAEIGLGGEEVTASVYIGQWERDYKLCEPCAATLQREINGVISHKFRLGDATIERIRASSLDELIAQRPYFSSTGHGAWCNVCGHWESECTCKGPAGDE